MNFFEFSSAAAALLIACSSLSHAAAPTSGPYVTDKTNQFVADQTSQALQGINNILCHIDAIAPAQFTNQPAYLALIDQNICSPNASGGKNQNNGPNYRKATVKTAQSSGGALLGDIWLSPSQGVTIQAHLAATQSPSAILPYGAFRLDYCSTSTIATTTCDSGKGYLEASATGLSYFADEIAVVPGMPGMTYNSSTALTLNTSGADTGSGAISQTNTAISVTPGMPGILPPGVTPNISLSFAFNATHFLRSDGTTSQCFDRALVRADKTAWSYGLYDATGAHLNIRTGFPIDYMNSSGMVVNGYIGYWGMWATDVSANGMVSMPASGTAINGYPNGTSTPVAYTLLQTGGKLMKHVRATKTLATMDKLRFWYSSMNPIPAAPAPAIVKAMTSYELYWDKGLNQFMVASVFDMTNGMMTPLATPVGIPNADMAIANPTGLQGWSSMTGGMFNIDATAMASLATNTSNTKVIFSSDDIVYPAEFAALGGLACIGDCPTAASIAAYNPMTVGSTPFANAGLGFPGAATVSTANLLSYTLDPVTGNLVDATNAQVISNSSMPFFSMNSGYSSGRFYAVVDQAALDAAKAASDAAFPGSSPVGQYANADLDLTNASTGSSFTTYTWQTSSGPMDQLSVLTDANGIPVRFDAPLNVNFTVPANMAGTNKPYGNLAGSTLTLTYNGFGDLWGIPFACFDLTTNTPCDFAALAASGPIAPPVTWSWKPEFTIPFDPAVGVVSATLPGTATATTFYVKPLDEEVRFANVPMSACTTGGLSLPTTTPVLPTAAGFIAPPVQGAAPAVSSQSPRVIQGVVQH